MSNGEPTYAHGKICYLEIPAENVAESATFYEKIFGWKIRSDNTDHTAFDDTVGGVSGMWVTGRKPLSDPGIIISIMVDDAKATLELIKQNGGIITQDIGKDLPEITAHFQDPAGNILGIYQHRG